MLIRNFLNAPLAKESIHEGEGLCEHAPIFHEEDFDTPLRFLNYTIIPPHASFGLHPHGDDNEMYILLQGAGEYTENNETFQVVAGDVMVSAPFATHGMKNTGDVPMRLLVVECYNKPYSR